MKELVDLASPNCRHSSSTETDGAIGSKSRKHRQRATRSLLVIIVNTRSGYLNKKIADEGSGFHSSLRLRLKEHFINSKSNSLHHKEKEMFDFRKIVLALVVFAIAIPMMSAQEGPDNLPFNCRVTSTPPLVRIEGVAELAGDILISCSGIVPEQGAGTNGILRDLRANVTLTADVPVTSKATTLPLDVNGRITTDALLINSGYQEGRCPASAFPGVQPGLIPDAICVPQPPASLTGTTSGYIGQGAPYTSGSPVFTSPYTATINNHGLWVPANISGNALGSTLEWDNVLLAPGSAQGRQWYMQMRIANVRVNAAALMGQGEFAPAISAVITLNTTTGTVPVTPDTVVIARPRPSFRIQSVNVPRRNCDSPRTLTQYLDIIELLPNAFKPRIDDEVNVCSTPGLQCNPNTAYFTESGLMIDNVWATTAPTVGNTGVADQGTQFQVQVISPTSLDNGTNNPYAVSVGAGWDATNATSSTSDPNPAGWMTSSSVGLGGETLPIGDRARNWRIEVNQFRLTADPFLINRLRVPITATYNDQVWGSTTFRVWYLPLAGTDQLTVALGAPVPRFVPEIKEAPGFTITRCRTLLLFPYITNRDGFNTGIAISNTSRDDSPGPFSTGGGANPQTGPCTLFLYGGNNGAANPVAQTPLESDVNVPAGGMYLMTLQTGGQVKGPAGEDVGAVGPAAGFQGYAIASCEFQYAHGYAFISDTQVQRVAQGYLALIIPDRVGETGSEQRPASPFNLEPGASQGGEQLVH